MTDCTPPGFPVIECPSCAITRAENASLRRALDRIIRAAQNRENTSGDPCRLLDCKAELRQATLEALRELTIISWEATG